MFLSCRCSDYVRHLIKVNEEKEAEVRKAKQDLEAKKAKMEEEKRTQTDPSEPESTTSSLTNSSQSEQLEKKRSQSGEAKAAKAVARHFESHESTISSGSSVDAKQAMNSVCVGATSTVSDITESKKDGSSSEDGTRKILESNESDGTVSSDAAVASRGETKGSSRFVQSDVAAVTKSESGPSGADTSLASERTSLDNDFQLDYEEVFLKSNVPQILAATNGRIVSYNEFFLKVSGLSRKEVESLTIFSLVKVSLLSNLFEIVAAALRSSTAEEDESIDQAGSQEKEKSQAHDEHKMAPLKDYAAMTLPCVDFTKIFGDDGERAATPFSDPARQLYMTVTLMTDKDVRKRCFHCAFTDCPGTEGALGTVTPELLSALFTNSHTIHDERKPSSKHTAS